MSSTPIARAWFVSATLFAAAAAAPAEPRPLPLPRATRPWTGERARVQAWAGNGTADRVRLSLTTDGIYAVDDAEFAAASGLPAATVADCLDSGLCRLSSRGREVPWLRTSGGIRFYGQALPADVPAPENVYFATFGEEGSPLLPRPSPPVPGATNDWYWHTVGFLGTNTVDARLTLENHAFSCIASRGGYTSASSLPTSKLLPISFPDAAPLPWQGRIAARFFSDFGVGPSDTHSLRLSLVDDTQGLTLASYEDAWSGEAVRLLSGVFAGVDDTGKSIGLQMSNTHRTSATTGDSFDNAFVYWERIEYAFPRRYRALDDALDCHGGAATNLSAGGFSSPCIAAWEVTDPAAPVPLSGLAVAPEDGAATYSATFACGGTNAAYAVCAAGAILRPAIRGVRDIDWGDPSLRAAHVTVIPPEGWVDGFRDALQPLADFRSSQGLPAIVVDAESIYNRYSHGIALASAIHDFMAEAHARWALPPRYLLLAGQGTVDGRNYRNQVYGLWTFSNAVTRCLLPVNLRPVRIYSAYSLGMPVAGKGTLGADDSAFGELDPLSPGPEVAVGRIPAVTAAMARTAVAKTLGYERRAARRAAVLSCSYSAGTANGLTFSNSVVRIGADLASGGRPVTLVVPTDGDTGMSLRNERLNLLLPALQRGDVGLYHYFGHSDFSGMGNIVTGNKYLLTKTDFLRDKNGTATQPTTAFFTKASPVWTQPACAILLGCNLSRWQFDRQGDYPSLGEAALFTPTGGFAALLSTTAYLGDQDSERFGLRFYGVLREGRCNRLGDLCRAAFASLEAEDHDTGDFRILGILGDPAIVLVSPGTRIMLF